MSAYDETGTPEYPLTKELRAELHRRDVPYSKGYVMATANSGKVHTDTDCVTTAWPVPGDALASLTFSEEDGEDGLLCEDTMTVAQAIGAVMGVTL